MNNTEAPRPDPLLLTAIESWSELAGESWLEDCSGEPDEWCEVCGEDGHNEDACTFLDERDWTDDWKDNAEPAEDEWLDG